MTTINNVNNARGFSPLPDNASSPLNTKNVNVHGLRLSTSPRPNTLPSFANPAFLDSPPTTKVSFKPLASPSSEQKPGLAGVNQLQQQSSNPGVMDRFSPSLETQQTTRNPIAPPPPDDSMDDLLSRFNALQEPSSKVSSPKATSASSMDDLLNRLNELEAPSSSQQTEPTPKLSQETIDTLRKKAHSENENIGLRFGKPEDKTGFTGDAYSLVPTEDNEKLVGMRKAFANHPVIGPSLKSQDTDEEFIKGVQAAVRNGVNWEVSKASEQLPPGATVAQVMEQIDNNMNILIADMGKKPVTERYSSQVDGQEQKTTPKFGNSGIPKPAESIQATIGLTSAKSSGHALVQNQQQLNQKMMAAGIDPNASIMGQQEQVQEFLARMITPKLNEVIKP